MKVVILAAGYGSRLLPYTKHYPKCMVEVNGEKIIDRQIKTILKCGINTSDIIVILGYKSNVAYNYLIKKYNNLNIIFNDQYSVTNNMFSLFLAKKYINDDLIIMNGDVFVEKNILSKVFLEKGKNYIICDKNKYNDESMKIKIDSNGFINSISKTINRYDSNALSIDIYHFSGNVLKELFCIIENYIVNKNEINLWTEVAIDDLLKKYNILPYYTNSKWFEIDNIEDLENANKLFKKN